MHLSSILKALYGAASAGVAAALAYVQGGGHSWLQGSLIASGAALGALAVVWAVPNTPTTSTGAKDAGK